VQVLCLCKYYLHQRCLRWHYLCCHCLCPFQCCPCWCCPYWCRPCQPPSASLPAGMHPCSGKVNRARSDPCPWPKCPFPDRSSTRAAPYRSSVVPEQCRSGAVSFRNRLPMKQGSFFRPRRANRAPACNSEAPWDVSLQIYLPGRCVSLACRTGAYLTGEHAPANIPQQIRLNRYTSVCVWDVANRTGMRHTRIFLIVSQMSSLRRYVSSRKLPTCLLLRAFSQAASSSGTSNPPGLPISRSLHVSI
jgi:hypothetical protein